MEFMFCWHSGEVEVVPTPWGPVSVTVAGDRSLTPLLTYHDVGVNHQGCFQQLMTASSHLSLLVRNFCFYHVDAPGCEAGGEFTPKDKKALDAENLAEQVRRQSDKKVNKLRKC
jgi:hypothetical protein